MLSPLMVNIANNQHVSNLQQFEVPLNYDINSPFEPNIWNEKVYPISIFRHIEFLEINFKNIFTFLLQIAHFIKTKKIEYSKILDITELQRFGEATYSFISTICYKTKVWTDFRIRVRTEIRYSSSYIISL